jgi:hypothetical protein
MGNCHSSGRDQSPVTRIGSPECKHAGPSIVDYQTLKKSGPLPLAFLRGVGLPDNFIEYIPSIVGRAIRFFTCFMRPLK